MEPQAASPQLKPPRDFCKCQYCREKKCKCGVYDYEKGERCPRCISAQLPCGPRIPHRSRIANPTNQAFANPIAKTAITTPNNIQTSYSNNSSSTSSYTRSLNLLQSSPTPGGIATPSSTPPDAYQRHRPRWSSFSTSYEAKASSVKELVHFKLQNLGYQGDIYESLSHQLHAAIAAQPHPGLQLQNEEEGTIRSLLALVLEKATVLSDDILDHVSQMTSSTDKKSYLRTFLDKVAYILALPLIPPRQRASTSSHRSAEPISPRAKKDDFHDLKSMHYYAALRLCSIIAESDVSEAIRQKRRVAELGKKYQILENEKELCISREELEKLSQGMEGALQSMRIPSQIAEVLPVESIFPPTHLAIQHDDLQMARTLLADSSSPQARDILKRQAIHIAATIGNLDLLRLAIGRDPTAVSARDIFDQTAVCIAAHHGNLEVFVQLLESGSDLHVRGVASQSVLALASGAGKFPIVEYLLTQGYRPNDAEEMKSLGVLSALHTAARGGHYDCVVILLQYDAEALLECQGLTAAQMAQNHGHETVAKLLFAVEKDHRASLSKKVELAEKRFMDSMLDESLISQMSSTSGSPHDMPGRRTPSRPESLAMPLLGSSLNTELTLGPSLSQDMIRSLSQAASLATSTPQACEDSLSPALSMVAKKRPQPSSSHRSSPSPSETLSHASSETRKRSRASNEPPKRSRYS